MYNFTLSSFKKESENYRVDGGDPNIIYSLTDYQQSDSEVTVSVDFIADLALSDYLDSDELKIKKEYKDKLFYGWSTIKGSCKFSIDINSLSANSNELDFSTDEFNIIDGKIFSVKLSDSTKSNKEFYEEEIQDIESKLFDFYKNNATYMVIAEYCRLFLVKVEE